VNLPPTEVEGGLTDNPTSISEIFSGDPDEWDRNVPGGEEKMRRMVEELRKHRVELETAPEKKTRVAKEKAAPREDLKGLSGKELLAKLLPGKAS